jgi:hypothetical protein
VTPNGELVTQAWIGQYAGIPQDHVAGVLPDASKWSDTGFLQIRALPGGPVDAELPHRRVFVAQADAWGTRTVRDIFRPEWAMAMDLMERLRLATFPDAQTYGKPVTLPKAGYTPARVLSVYLLGEPTRVERDPSGFARMTCNLSVTWTV